MTQRVKGLRFVTGADLDMNNPNKEGSVGYLREKSLAEAASEEVAEEAAVEEETVPEPPPSAPEPPPEQPEAPEDE